MSALDRRSLLKALSALPFAPYLLGQTESESLHVVRSGTDRTGRMHKAARANTHLDFKVLTVETDGGLFIMENRNMLRGGPPRHIHFEQQEWFYFLEGSDDVLMEIGERKLRLKPGDSVLAPRAVPHVWAYLGEKPGRMLFAFTPAARIESFFEEASRPDAKVDDPGRFERNGMKVVGPPLLGS
ncbi:MAG TPA: cupin domain-containing protein [Acidobacteriaceae bacterium]|jgi:mannose-6-phosphate isomerase-like protein (cupin superfamily)|nr:cupin domain-containing protein [Acidobacteriaceae bacterium]